SLVYDILYRPKELENVPMWDQIGEYVKIRRRTRKRRRTAAPENLENSDTESESDVISVSDSSELLFLPIHPQYTTHALRKRKIRHIPVLCGWPIPRRDLADQNDKYSVSVLSLFQPWARSLTDPLKQDNVSWNDALAQLLSRLPPHHLEVIDHMQEQWECKLAADDFS
ncbi:hypothetical protein GGX14DRAFT_300754, partial [Mycena pura]